MSDGSASAIPLPSELALSASGEQGLASLDRLSRKHYGFSITKLLDAPEVRSAQLVRLLGSMLKEPFSYEVNIHPRGGTQAVVHLEWNGPEEIRQNCNGVWQFDLLRSLIELHTRGPLTDDQVIEELLTFEHEASLGRFVLESFHHLLCGDPQKRQIIDDAIATAKKAGVTLMEPTVTGLSVGTASVVAVAIASLMPPIFAAVSAPLLGALALLLVRSGLDGFCRWIVHAVLATPEGRVGEIGITHSRFPDLG